MSLQAGHQLAHYEIVEPIGKGGMGEVYRAKDSKLGRDVAIKVLPDEFAQDDERLRRFQREAKVLASLNHPNIASIYGLEQSGETHYFVLELVPGETLAERIARGPIPVDEALDIATKIAEALEEAHELGIVHRDLKPANIKLTPDDKVKVLDFGLAKAFAQESAEGDAATSTSPTITRDATRVGVILGTAAYMSPEQAKGKRVDKRADIFAFGTVLYEMLTGSKAFAGDDVSEVLASVIRAEPDWALLPVLPANVRTLLARCFDKDPKRRLRDIGEARLAFEGGSDIGGGEPVARRSGYLTVVLLAVLAGAFLAAIAIPLLTNAEDVNAPTPTTVRFDIPVPGARDGHLPSTFAMTKDGDIVFARRVGTTQQLYRRSPGDKGYATIRGTEGGNAPFLSPDEEWVGFHADGELKKIRLEGGLASTICAAARTYGASWENDDRIVFASDAGLLEVSSAGGTAEVLVASGPVDGSPRVLSSPELLPGARAVLFTEESGPAARVTLFSIQTGEERTLLDGAHARYLSSGHIAFVRDQTLWVVPFDVGSLALVGEAVPIVEASTRTESTRS